MFRLSARIILGSRIWMFTPDGPGGRFGGGALTVATL